MQSWKSVLPCNVVPSKWDFQTQAFDTRIMQQLCTVICVRFEAKPRKVHPVLENLSQVISMFEHLQTNPKSRRTSLPTRLYILLAGLDILGRQPPENQQNFVSPPDSAASVCLTLYIDGPLLELTLHNSRQFEDMLRDANRHSWSTRGKNFQRTNAVSCLFPYCPPKSPQHFSPPFAARSISAIIMSFQTVAATRGL